MMPCVPRRPARRAAAGLVVFLAVAAIASRATRLDPLTPAARAESAPASQETDEHEVAIIRALDEPIDLDVEGVPIRQALDQLASRTGIAIRLAPGCISLLPYGSQTKLSATIRNRPLRESLGALLSPLGLEFAPARRELLVQPGPALSRIGRRATWDELALIEKLSTQPMTPKLFTSLRFQFQDTAAGGAGATREELSRLAAGVGEGSAARVLEHACGLRGWTWYPEGQVIAILSKARQVERQLEQRVTLRYTQALLAEALADLAGRAGVLLRLDPGVLASLPPQTSERFSLSVENATIRQVLEVIAGETGLGYAVEPGGVRITRAGVRLPAGGAATAPAAGDSATQLEVAAQAAAAVIRSNSVVGQLTFPLPDGSSFSFFVRQNDLPPEVNALRQARIARSINEIRRRLHAEQQQD